MPIESTIEMLLSDGASYIESTNKNLGSFKPEFLCYFALLTKDVIGIVYDGLNDAKERIKNRLLRYY